MLLGLLMLALGVMAFQNMILVSKWMTSQHILNRSAQAAVLSGAHYQARILNTHALINRTQMAHQVAMAHLITVASALHHAQQMQDRVRRSNPPVYLIGAFFGPHHAAAYMAAKLLVPSKSGGALRHLKKAFHQHDNTMQRQLERARQTLFNNIDIQTYDLIQKTFMQNIRRHGLSEHWQSLTNINFDQNMRLNVTQKGVTSQDMVKDKNLAMWQPWLERIIGLHAYLKPRDDTVRNFWIIDPKCPHVFHSLRRQGQTTVQASGFYEATDSLSFHARRKLLPYFCYLREYPMGWGKVSTEATHHWHENSKAAPRRFNQTTFREWAQGAVSNLGWLIGIPRNQLASAWAIGQRQTWQAHQTPEPAKLKNSNSHFVLSLNVSIKQAWFKKADARVHWHTLGLNKLSNKLSPKQLVSQASAQVYFSQIENSETQKIYQPSLFQSFWQAKRIKAQSD
jgi:hypothetical protein